MTDRTEFKVYAKIVIFVLIAMMIVHYLYHMYELHRFTQGASKRVRIFISKLK